jgi:phenylacetic acid degradation protein PaaD
MTDRNDDLASASAGAMFADDLASQQAGIEVRDIAPGRASATMTVSERMINGHEICHGGYIFMLADTAFALACNTYGVPTVAQACDIVFIKPARLGDDLVATATERHRFGRNGIYDVTVLDGNDIVAEFRGRSRAIGPRPT